MLHHLTSRAVIINPLKVALVVGTCLNAINREPT
jgi:hypothetical protein